MIMLMKNNILTESEKELKSKVMDQLEDVVDDYFNTYQLKDSKTNKLCSIDQIENILSDLKLKTREIILDMVSESISNYDESEEIKLKKANSKKEG